MKFAALEGLQFEVSKDNVVAKLPSFFIYTVTVLVSPGSRVPHAMLVFSVVHQESE